MKPTVQAKEWEKELKKITASIISPDGDGCTSSSIAGLQEYPKLVSFISSTLAEARKETVKEIEGIIDTEIKLLWKYHETENDTAAREFNGGLDLAIKHFEDILSVLKEKGI